MKNSILTVLLLWFFCAGCEWPANIDVPHEPLLQVNTTFIAGDSLPEISVRRSFKNTGREAFTVPASEILVSGADVALFRNGRKVLATQKSAGIYRFAADSLVKMGEMLEVQVAWNGQTVKARTRVPQIDINQFSVSVSAIEVPYNTTMYLARRDAPPRNPVRDTVLLSELRFTYRQPFVTAFTGVKIATENRTRFEQEYFLPAPSNYGWVVYGGMRLFGDAFTGLSEMSGQVELEFYTKGRNKPSQPVEVDFTVEVVVPDDFYATYVRQLSDDIVPITITNVEGGVGMVIGAVRKEFQLRRMVTL